MQYHKTFLKVLLGALLLAAASFSKGTTVIKIEDKSITRERIDSLVQLLSKQQFPDKVLTSEEKEYLNKVVAGNLLGQELLWLEATKKNIQVPPTEVDSMFKVFKKGFPDEATYKRALKEIGDNEANLKDKIKKQILIEKLLLQKLNPLQRPSEAEMKKFYEANKKEFKADNKLRASQIVLKLPKSPGVAQVEEKRVQLENLRSKLITLEHPDQKMEAFAQLAYQHSDTPESKEGGDLKQFQYGDFFPEFDKAIKKMTVGDISEVFRTPIGLHLVLLTEKNDGNFENFKVKILQAMVAQKSVANQKSLQDYFEELMKKYKVTYLDPAYKGKISAQMDGNMSGN